MGVFIAKIKDDDECWYKIVDQIMNDELSEIVLGDAVAYDPNNTEANQWFKIDGFDQKEGFLPLLAQQIKIVSIYLEEGNYTDAFALANMLPTLYGLSSDDLTEHNDYLALLNLYSVLNADKRNTMQLDSTERASVEYIAEFGTGTPQAMAKSIMMGAYGYRYNDCPGELDLDYPINGRGNVVTSSISDADLNKAMGFSIAVSPNPANTWIAVDYTLPAGATKAQMRIVNALGMTVATYDLQGKETQKVLDLRDLASGVYTYTVFCGKYSQNGKLVIVK